MSHQHKTCNGEKQDNKWCWLSRASFTKHNMKYGPTFDITWLINYFLLLFIIGNKALIKLLGSLYEVGMDHMCDNVGGLISLLNDSNANTDTQLNAEEREVVIEILSKMCAKRCKVSFFFQSGQNPHTCIELKFLFVIYYHFYAG